MREKASRRSENEVLTGGGTGTEIETGITGMAGPRSVGIVMAIRSTTVGSSVEALAGVPGVLNRNSRMGADDSHDAADGARRPEGGDAEGDEEGPVEARQEPLELEPGTEEVGGRGVVRGAAVRGQARPVSFHG